MALSTPPQTLSARLALLTAAGLLVLCWLAFFNHLGTLSLMDKTEALFVEVGREMLQRNDWITPHWNGEPFFDYPVWGYWMVALSFRFFGVSEWAARLPVATAASAVVLAGFALLWISGSDQAGQLIRWQRAWLGAGVLALNPGWVGWGRISVTDMFLASAITLCLFGFFLSYSQPERPWLRRLGYGAMPVFSAVAVLAKGPVGLVVPGLVIGVFLLCQGQLRAVFRQMPILAMALVFLAVASPWYVLAARPMAWPSWVDSSGSATWSVTPPCSMATPGPGTSTCPGFCCCCCPGPVFCRWLWRGWATGGSGDGGSKRGGTSWHPSSWSG